MLGGVAQQSLRDWVTVYKTYIVYLKESSCVLKNLKASGKTGNAFSQTFFNRIESINEEACSSSVEQMQRDEIITFLRSKSVRHRKSPRELRGESPRKLRFSTTAQHTVSLLRAAVTVAPARKIPDRGKWSPHLAPHPGYLRDPRGAAPQHHTPHISHPNSARSGLRSARAH